MSKCEAKFHNMATTSMWAIRTRLDHLVKYVSNKEKTTLISTVIDYATNAEKTMEHQFVSCINCMQDNPYASMVQTKKLFHDEKEILCYHGYQSFSEGEVTPELAHEIGVKLANEIWGNRFEVIISTHLNTENIHNHFLVNATSCTDGKRFCNSKHDRYVMMHTSDELCRQYNLSVIDEKTRNTKRRGQYRNEKSLRTKIKTDINEIIRTSLTVTQFFNQLEFEGYDIKITNNNVSLRHPQHTNFIRLSSLGADYHSDVIKQRILKNEVHPLEKRTIYDTKGFDIKLYYQKYKTNSLTGLQKLYLHYQYKLGIIPKRSNTKPHYSKELRQAIRNLDEISDQTILLCENNIETLEQLHQYQAPLLEQLSALMNKRQHCYYKIRRCTNNDERNNLKLEAKSYTPRIKELRKEIKSCDGIEERSALIQKIDFRQLDHRRNR